MKQKTHSGAKKRIKLSANKKASSKKPGRNHLLFGKSKRAKRGSRKGIGVLAADRSEIKRLMPNSF